MPYRPGQYLNQIPGPMEQVGSTMKIFKQFADEGRAQQRMAIDIRQEYRSQLKFEMDVQQKIADEQRKKRAEERDTNRYAFEQFNIMYKRLPEGAEKNHVGELMWGVAKRYDELKDVVEGALVAGVTDLEIKEFQYNHRNPGPNGSYAKPMPTLNQFKPVGKPGGGGKEQQGFTDNQITAWSDTAWNWVKNDRARHKILFGQDKPLPSSVPLGKRPIKIGDKEYEDDHFAVFTEEGIRVRSRFALTEGNKIAKAFGVSPEKLEYYDWKVPFDDRASVSGGKNRIIQTRLNTVTGQMETASVPVKTPPGQKPAPVQTESWEAPQDVKNKLAMLSYATNPKLKGQMGQEWSWNGTAIIENTENIVSNKILSDLLERQDIAETPEEKLIYDRLINIAQQREQLISDPQRGFGLGEPLFGLGNLKWMSSATSEKTQLAIISLYKDLGEMLSVNQPVDYRFIPMFEIHRGKGVLSKIGTRLPGTKQFIMDPTSKSNQTLSEIGYDTGDQDYSMMALWVAVPKGNVIPIPHKPEQEINKKTGKPVFNEDGTPKMVTKFTYYNEHTWTLKDGTTQQTDIYTPLGYKTNFTLDQLRNILGQETRTELYKNKRRQQGMLLRPELTEEIMDIYAQQAFPGEK